MAYGLASQRQDTSIDEALAQDRRVQAPVSVLPRLGKPGTASLADFRGKVVVLNFWASYCSFCVKELPLLERTHRAIAHQNAMVLGVSWMDVTDDALGFARKYEVSFPNVRDADGRYGERYGTYILPETFIIDREGRVAARRRGPVDKAWLDEHLKPLL